VLRHRLRILDDGVILKSQANLIASNLAPWSPAIEGLRDQITRSLQGALKG
jgi:ATP phosphoribosyltransferase